MGAANFKGWSKSAFAFFACFDFDVKMSVWELILTQVDTKMLV